MNERTVGKYYETDRHEVNGRPRTIEEMIDYLYCDARRVCYYLLHDLKALGYLPDDEE